MSAMRFTTEEAYDASECGEPIMLSRADAERIIRDHDAEGDFFAEHAGESGAYDAAALLGWLGY